VTITSDNPTKETAETSMTSPKESYDKALTTTEGTTLKTSTLLTPTMTPSVLTVTEPATPAALNKTSIEPLKTPQKPQATFEGTVKPVIAATVKTLITSTIETLKPTTVATIHPARPSPDSLDAGEVLTVDTTCNGNLKAEDRDIVTLRDLLTAKAHDQDHLFGTSDAWRHP
ncbi:hypothetical protein F5Y18DRAFT_405044, partial [Xylariaceae sp. FL1019]